MGLKDRVAIITGATGGLGSIVARRMAEEGARLALLSTNMERLEQLQASLSLPDERVMTHTVDLGDADATLEAARIVREKFSQADILLHLVGGWTGGKSVLDAPTSDVQSMLDQHVWTTFNTLQAFIPMLVENGWGRVLAISTPFAMRPAANGAPYALAKAAQEALLLGLSQELKETNVTTNIIQVRSIEVSKDPGQPGTAKKASSTSAEEITSLILYLCSEETGKINGARIPMQGSYI